MSTIKLVLLLEQCGNQLAITKLFLSASIPHKHESQPQLGDESFYRSCNIFDLPSVNVYKQKQKQGFPFTSSDQKLQHFTNMISKNLFKTLEMIQTCNTFILLI